MDHHGDLEQSTLLNLTRMDVMCGIRHFANLANDEISRLGVKIDRSAPVKLILDEQT